jgi:hypothetical protein
VSDRSFLRAGAYAGILLAVTSWAAVVAYYTVGLGLFQGLYALIAFWALVGITAVHYRIRDAGPAWAAFATLVGAIAAVGTIAGALYEVARLQSGETALASVNPANPLNVMTFGLTGIWFLVASILLLRTPRIPSLLAVLGFVAVADLEVGFIASLAAVAPLVTLTAVVAGAIGGPLFWLWLGVVLLREA